MKFPTYSAYKSPPVGVVEGYVGFVGGTEDDDRKLIDSLPPTDLLQVAARIGRGCLIAARGADQAATRVFKRAERDLAPHLTPRKRTSRVGRRAAQLFSTAQMLEFRDDGSAVTEARHNMHLDTTTDIKRLLELLSRTGEHRLSGGMASDVKGELIEKIGLGMATRFSAHPWLMGIGALIQQDQGRGARCHNNFDMLLVETSSERSLVVPNKVQVKTGCLGLCPEPQPDRQIDRSRYLSSITFLSSCCDLGIRSPGFKADEYRLADLLVREADDVATPTELSELDIASGSLLLSLTSGSELRRGTYDLAG